MDVHAQAIQNARVCAEILDDAKIRHAVTGGLAVHYHASRKPRGFAHWRPHVDVLVPRRQASLANAALKRRGIRSGTFEDGIASVRLIVSNNDALLKDDCVETTELGFRCLRLLPLVETKLKAFRSKDRVHVQDLMEQKLITKKVEAALPQELRERLEQVKDDTKREALG